MPTSTTTTEDTMTKEQRGLYESLKAREAAGERIPPHWWPLTPEQAREAAAERRHESRVS